MKKNIILSSIFLGLLLSISCSDKSKTTDPSIQDVNPNDLTTINIELHADKIIIQNTQFNRQTDESQYKTLIINEIKQFRDKDLDMENFIIKIQIHEDVSRKDIAEFEEFLREEKVTVILYDTIESKDQST